MNRSELRTMVLAYLQKHPHEGFKSRQLKRRLNLDTDYEFQTLRDVLHKMVDKKELAWTKNRGYHKAAVKGKGVSGTIVISKQGFGIVTTDGGEEVFVDKRSLGTALNGDTVDVVLFAAKKQSTNTERLIEGEIVAVTARKQTEFIGTVERSQNFSFVRPDDPTMHRDIYIAEAGLNNAHPGDKVIVELMQWDDVHLNPEGTVKTVLGKAGDPFVEVRSVIQAFKLPTSFPKNVEQEVAAFGDSIPETEKSKRKDLRAAVIVTIDPYDAKDFDDALSIELLSDGSYSLGVHIADVSAYVREGSAVDGEAYTRGTSVYLANQVIPMLPEKLSNKLCSLMPNVDRLAFSCFMTISPRGKITDYSFARSIINSKRRFTYEEVEDILDSHKGDYERELADLWSLAKILRKKRMKNGSINFDSPEAKFRYDEYGKPVEITIKKRLKSHELVEECMLAANQTVATHISTLAVKKVVPPFVYRVHATPDPDKLRNLSLFVQKFGHSLNITESSSSKELQKLLEEVKDTKEENVINEVALRSMAKAVYSKENIGHYGLGFSHYTHFTSPIRRYPDLIVHRMLDEYLHGMSTARREYFEEHLSEMCRHTSMREKVATDAERETIKVMQVEYMKQHVGDEFEGIISGVMQYGIFIELNDILVEGMLHVRDLDDDYYSYDEKQYSLIGEKRGHHYRLGDTITVTVAKVNPERRQIDFVLAEKDIKIESIKQKKSAKRRRH